MPDGGGAARRAAGARRERDRRAPGRHARALHALSDADQGCQRKSDRRCQHARRHHRAEGRRGDPGASCRDRRAIRRRHRQQVPRRRHPDLEPRRAAYVRLQRRGSGWPAHHAHHSRRAPRRGRHGARQGAQRRDGGPLRDRAPREGWPADRHLAHGLADSRGAGPRDRRLEDRARHHRAQAPRRRAVRAGRQAARGRYPQGRVHCHARARAAQPALRYRRGDGSPHPLETRGPQGALRCAGDRAPGAPAPAPGRRSAQRGAHHERQADAAQGAARAARLCRARHRRLSRAGAEGHLDRRRGRRGLGRRRSRAAQADDREPARQRDQVWRQQHHRHGVGRGARRAPRRPG